MSAGEWGFVIFKNPQFEIVGGTPLMLLKFGFYEYMWASSWIFFANWTNLVAFTGMHGLIASLNLGLVSCGWLGNNACLGLFGVPQLVLLDINNHGSSSTFESFIRHPLVLSSFTNHPHDSPISHQKGFHISFRFEV